MTDTALHGHLVTSAGAVADPPIAAVHAALDAGQSFWLDLTAVDDTVTGLLRDGFALHPLAVEDVEHFGQRPKADAYDEFLVAVVYGVSADGTPIEVHCFYSDRYLVTVRQSPCADIDQLVPTARDHSGAVAPIWVWHRVLDRLTDSFFPVLDAIDESIDALEDDILQRPTEAQLGRLFGFKRRLILLRRLAWEQRDLFASLLTEPIAGMTVDAGRYFRDLYDHSVRISETADSYRDLLGAAIDTHMSMTSNRLNLVMKQLTIIATIFLPMSFLTGFFGQNFAWMVERIGGAPAFWIVGVGLQFVVAGGLLLMFRRKGWLGGATAR